MVIYILGVNEHYGVPFETIFKVLHKKCNQIFIGVGKSSDNYGDNLVRTCEVLDLETKNIIYAGNLRGPDSHLQMVTLGASESTVVFSTPGPVAKEDMVIWNPEDSTWNQNFPAGAGDPRPARFGAAVVSMEMICPAH